MMRGNYSQSYIDSQKDFSGELHPFYNIPGVADRCWAHNGGVTIASEKEGSYYDSDFLLYLGYPVSVPVETMDAALEVGETVVWDGKIVGRDTVITVKQGSTLVIDGKCYNNGKIVVDGGTLIVKGLLDMDIFDVEPQEHAFPPGTLVVQNGGLVLIERTGCMMQRNSKSAVTVTDNSTMIVNGSAVLCNGLTVSNYSRFESSFGCFVGLGLRPSSTIEQTRYTANSIKEYSYYYGSDLFSNGASMIAWPVLTVSNNSAAYMNGGFFASSGYNVVSDGSSMINGSRSKNLNATIGSMVDY